MDAYRDVHFSAGYAMGSWTEHAAQVETLLMEDLHPFDRIKDMT